MCLFGENVRGSLWYNHIFSYNLVTHNPVKLDGLPFRLPLKLAFPQSSRFVSAALIKMEWKTCQKSVSAVVEVVKYRCCWWAKLICLCLTFIYRGIRLWKASQFQIFCHVMTAYPGNKQICDIFSKINSATLTLCIWKYPGKLNASSAFIAIKCKWVGTIALD